MCVHVCMYTYVNIFLSLGKPPPPLPQVLRAPCQGHARDLQDACPGMTAHGGGGTWCRIGSRGQGGGIWARCLGTSSARLGEPHSPHPGRMGGPVGTNVPPMPTMLSARPLPPSLYQTERVQVWGPGPILHPFRWLIPEKTMALLTNPGSPLETKASVRASDQSLWFGHPHPSSGRGSHRTSPCQGHFLGTRLLPYSSLRRCRAGWGPHAGVDAGHGPAGRVWPPTHYRPWRGT